MATRYQVTCPHCEHDNTRETQPGETLMCDWCGNSFAVDLIPYNQDRRQGRRCNASDTLNTDHGSW